MKAVRIHEHGGPEKLLLEDAPRPEPRAGEVLLRVHAAALNHLDLFVRRGMPGVRVAFPRIPGADAAGVVEAVAPDVTSVRVGQRVLVNPGVSCGQCEFCASGEGSLCVSYRLLGESGDGTYAEYVALPARNCLELPAGMGFVEAAAAPLVFLTAWRMLVTRARLRPGEDVLVWGAGAGVGTAVVQIARLAGARVFATAGGAAKCERARALGAEHVLDHASQDVEAEVRRLTGKRGVDVVIDYVGKETWGKSLRCVRRGGRIVTCGATTGFDPVEDLRHIFFRQLQLLGSTMGSPEEFRQVMSCVFRGQLRPIVYRSFPLAEAAAAHRLLESREPFGKVVLEV
ncbi:MAG: zinc-binding dehydrogenase [Planctomycetes bacterium]|nr:zinc-binding dehydrogenase [Planctomycetota bacterium]